jgi:hypothetical protein
VQKEGDPIMGITLLWLACIIGCVVMAINQGRSGLVGFVLGFFFSIFALIGYLIAGDTVEVKARKHVELEAKIAAMKNKE